MAAQYEHEVRHWVIGLEFVCTHPPPDSFYSHLQPLYFPRQVSGIMQANASTEMCVIGISMERYSPPPGNITHGAHMKTENKQTQNRSVWDTDGQVHGVGKRVLNLQLLSAPRPVGREPVTNRSGDGSMHFLHPLNQNGMLSCIKGGT